MAVPSNLQGLWRQEGTLRSASDDLITCDARLTLHLVLAESAMDLCDLFRQTPTDDEDTKVIQVLGMRIFNAFGAGLLLLRSGYLQNSALVLRDVLETVFLLDYFRSDLSAITRWRTSKGKAYREEFKPVAVRTALDKRDGFTSKKRDEVYKMFCELAGHPTMKSAAMMRPKENGDAAIGPFVELSGLSAVASELGRLAVQAGEVISLFLPRRDILWLAARVKFSDLRAKWMQEFYPQTDSGTTSQSQSNIQ